MKTTTGIEYKVGQRRHYNGKDLICTLLCKAQDGQEFEIELEDGECVCCLPFGSLENREILESEIDEVLNDWNEQ